MIRRRNSTLFSISFLDCICCGFGAIILLFVITMGSEVKTIQEMRMQLQRLLQSQLASLAQFRSEREELERMSRNRAFIETQVEEQERLKAMLDQLEQQIMNRNAGKEALLVKLDEMQQEVAVRQKEAEMALPDVEPMPVGVPVGSNYIAFVLDTSGSMREPVSVQIWPIVIQKIEEVLDIYPSVQGIQILDADGRFIIGGDNRWHPDTPEVRERIKHAIRRYDIFSNSNPVPGIIRALRTLHDPNAPDMKMGLYIFGDEFTGTAETVLRRLDEINPVDESGNRRVVINAVGFPTAVRFGLSMANTGLKFANLMREVTHQHGGAFVALQDL